MTPTYTFTPRAFGRTITLSLDQDVLVVDDTIREQRFPLTDIAAVRLAYEPTNAFGHGFTAKIVIAGGRSITVKSRHATSFALTEDRRVAYAAFLRALLPQVARKNPDCRFDAGRSWPAFAVLAAVSAAVATGIAAMLVEAVGKAGLLVLVVLATAGAGLLWVMAEMVRRNRPRRFDPSDPPADLLG